MGQIDEQMLRDCHRSMARWRARCVRSLADLEERAQERSFVLQLHARISNVEHLIEDILQWERTQ